MKKYTYHPTTITKNPRTSLVLALLVAGVAHVDLAQAAVVNSGDRLTITTGVPAYNTAGSQINITSGSWFAFDDNANNKVDTTEKFGLSQGTTGLVIGATTPAGAYHPGAPLPGDTNEIDKPFYFFGDTGSDYLTVAATGSTTAGLNLSGWTMAWDTVSIVLGSGAWTPLNCGADIAGCGAHTFTNGNAQLIWDGVYGDAYTLNYAATTPPGDPSGISGVQYFLHLEGTVQAVPLPTAVWLFGSGLMGLLGVARRRQT
ncbi:MAG: hypothetical protein ACYC9J_09450 [Sulfuricaulis sp.]